MNIGYARVSKAGDAQNIDLQYDALTEAGVTKEAIYEDRASGKKDDRPGLAACLEALRWGDTLVVWKLDRLGRDLRHLVSVVEELTERGIPGHQGFGIRFWLKRGVVLNLSTAFAGMSMAWPVCGLRQVRAAGSVTLNLTKPGKLNSPSERSASAICSKL